MRCIGIISEYNPFHSGHRYHIEETLKKCGSSMPVISVMGGDFTQRGEPAVFDKWERAEAAVKNGVNLVLELPFAYACNGAEYFAKGGVGVLNGLGLVDFISFGSEAGDVELLKRIAHVSACESSLFRDALNSSLQTGCSYAAAKASALKTVLGADGDAALLPNNILGIEYISELMKSGSQIEPVTIRRAGPGHNETRKMLLESGRAAITTEHYRNTVFNKIVTTDAAHLDNLVGGGEGLGNKMKKDLPVCSTVKELISACVSKRYTTARISRLLTALLTDFTKAGFAEMQKEGLYARVLAFDSKGAEVLSTIKKQECASVPVITNINKTDTSSVEKTLAMDIRAADVYNVLAGKDIYSNSDKVRTPCILK